METTLLNTENTNLPLGQKQAQEAIYSERGSTSKQKKDRLTVWIQEFEKAIKQINAGVL